MLRQVAAAPGGEDRLQGSRVGSRARRLRRGGLLSGDPEPRKPKIQGSGNSQGLFGTYGNPNPSCMWVLPPFLTFFGGRVPFKLNQPKKMPSFLFSPGHWASEKSVVFCFSAGGGGYGGPRGATSMNWACGFLFWGSQGSRNSARSGATFLDRLVFPVWSILVWCPQFGAF